MKLKHVPGQQKIKKKNTNKNKSMRKVPKVEGHTDTKMKCALKFKLAKQKNWSRKLKNLLSMSATAFK